MEVVLLGVREGWKNDCDLVFDGVETAAKDWQTIQAFQKHEKHDALRGKSGTGGEVTGAAAEAPVRRCARVLDLWWCWAPVV